MTFYALHSQGVETERLECLEKACKKLRISFRALDPQSFDFSKPSPVKKGDIVFRISRGRMLRFFEDYIIRPGVVTFYMDLFFHKQDFFMLERAGIPVPETVFCGNGDSSKLMGYVKKLGGFPVVVKAMGGTHGMGVMRIDTYQSLISITDFLSTQSKLVVMRKYIPVTNSARFIVIGDKVVASLEYRARNMDFRSNASQSPDVRGKKYSAELEALAVKATHSLGLEFGGVDILIDGKKAYVSEVNFPCNFVRAQKALKQDIALQMVKYLAAKAERM
jgi:hypothetical protein